MNMHSERLKPFLDFYYVDLKIRLASQDTPTSLLDDCTDVLREIRERHPGYFEVPCKQEKGMHSEYFHSERGRVVDIKEYLWYRVGIDWFPFQDSYDSEADRMRCRDLVQPWREALKEDCCWNQCLSNMDIEDVIFAAALSESEDMRRWPTPVKGVNLSYSPKKKTLKDRLTLPEPNRRIPSFDDCLRRQARKNAGESLLYPFLDWPFIDVAIELAMAFPDGALLRELATLAETIGGRHPGYFESPCDPQGSFEPEPFDSENRAVFQMHSELRLFFQNRSHIGQPWDRYERMRCRNTINNMRGRLIECCCWFRAFSDTDVQDLVYAAALYRGYSIDFHRKPVEGVFSHYNRWSRWFRK